MNRDFTANGPDELWVADITYIPMSVGFLYLAIVLDVLSPFTYPTAPTARFTEAPFSLGVATTP